MLQIQTGNSLSEAYFRLSVGLHRFLKVILKAMRKAKKKKKIVFYFILALGFGVQMIILTNS